MNIDEISIGVSNTDGRVTIVVCSKDWHTGVVTVLASEVVKAWEDKCIRLPIKPKILAV